MIKIITLAIACFSLISCEGLTVGVDNEDFTGSYSAKGGLIVAPKAIQIIEAKP